MADAAFMLLGVAAASTGAIVTSRARGNAIGPLLLALGVGVGDDAGLGAYAQLSAKTSAGPLPAAMGGWFGDWPGIAILWGVPPFLLLLFPDGHLMSPRWRPVAWFTGVGVACATRVGGALLPGEVQGAANPVRWWAGPRVTSCAASMDVTDLLALPALLMAAASLDRALAPLARRRAAAAEVVHLRRGGDGRRPRRDDRSRTEPWPASSFVVGLFGARPRSRSPRASRSSATGSTTSTS